MTPFSDSSHVTPAHCDFISVFPLHSLVFNLLGNIFIFYFLSSSCKFVIQSYSDLYAAYFSPSLFFSLYVSFSLSPFLSLSLSLPSDISPSIPILLSFLLMHILYSIYCLSFISLFHHLRSIYRHRHCSPSSPPPPPSPLPPPPLSLT